MKTSEYAKLFAMILADLRDRMKNTPKHPDLSAIEYGASRTNIDMSKMEPIAKAVRSFLSQFESRLNPDGCHDPSLGGPKSPWPLKHDEVMYFVDQADELLGKIGLPHPT